MEAGAAGAEIVIRGKLRTERARFEKFRDGYLPKSGDPALKNLREAVLNVQLKPGMYGIKVRILPANSPFPDQVQIIAVPEEPSKPEAVEAPKEAEKLEKPEEETEKTEETKKPKKKPAAPQESTPPETPTEPEAAEEKTEEAPQ
jgi:small subunit ribosomal protein S3